MFLQVKMVATIINTFKGVDNNGIILFPGGRRECTPRHPLKMQVTHHNHLLEEPKKHSNIEIVNTNTNSIQK